MSRSLTHREMELAELITFGLTEKEICHVLGISHNTVKSYKRHLFGKTGCRNIADVTRWYIQEVSGIKLHPKETIKKLISAFLLALVLVAEFNIDDQMVRARKVRAPATRVLKISRTRTRKNESLELQIA